MNSPITLGLIAALAFGALLIAPTACALLNTTRDAVGDAVERYCRESPTDRKAYDALLNERLKPHRASITCAGDPNP